MLDFSSYFQDVEFDEKNHTYRIRDKVLTSATTLVSSLEQPFDSDYHATRKGQKSGQSKDQILKEWKDKSELALANGKFVHKYCEVCLRGQYFVPGVLTVPQEIVESSEARAFDKFWREKRDTLEPIQIEWRVGDYQLGIGGTIDCFFYSQKTHLYHPMDWKTGKMSFTNSFQALKPPFDGYEDTSYNRYSIQLSLYRLILRRAGITQLGEGYIVHLQSDGDYQPYRAIDYTQLLEDWLLNLEKLQNRYP